MGQTRSVPFSVRQSRPLSGGAMSNPRDVAQEQTLVSAAFSTAQEGYRSFLESPFAQREFAAKWFNAPHESGFLLYQDAQHVDLLPDFEAHHDPADPCMMADSNIFPLVPGNIQRGHVHVRACQPRMAEVLSDAVQRPLTSDEHAACPFYYPSHTDLQTNLGASVFYSSPQSLDAPIQYTPCVEHVLSEYGLITFLPSFQLVRYIHETAVKNKMEPTEIVQMVVANLNMSVFNDGLLKFLEDGSFARKDFWKFYVDTLATNATAVLYPRRYPRNAPLFHVQVLTPSNSIHVSSRPAVTITQSAITRVLARSKVEKKRVASQRPLYVRRVPRATRSVMGRSKQASS